MIELNQIHEIDVLEGMKQIPDGSINCIITSPPYWQLRDYGWIGQWGLEPTYQKYLEHLWQFMDESYRVLRDDGTAWINLGDSYSSISGGMRRGDVGKISAKAIQGSKFEQTKPKDVPFKCLMLIPHRFAIGCIDRGWILRNDIIWAKRNGMPESTGDRFSKKHEFFFFFVKSQKYYFDLDGIRGKYQFDTLTKYKSDSEIGRFKKESKFENVDIQGKRRTFPANIESLNGKNPGDVSDFWDIPTRPSSKNHYATYNTDLIDKPIIAGCPEFVCAKCGKPREKIFEELETPRTRKNEYQVIASGKSGGTNKTFNGGNNRQIIDLTDCGCNAGFTGGTILDPFCGTGTTLYRAMQLNRNAIGLDGKKEYCEMGNRDLSKLLLQEKLAI